MQSHKEEDTVDISLRWRGPSKISVCWLNAAQTSNAVARKRLGHFTVSSQEEQIASALHDRSRDWPERGLCLPRGEARMAWLSCTGWHVVWGNWDPVGVGGCTSLSSCLSKLSSVMQLWELWCHAAMQAASVVSLTKGADTPGWLSASVGFRPTMSVDTPYSDWCVQHRRGFSAGRRLFGRKPADSQSAKGSRQKKSLRLAVQL